MSRFWATIVLVFVGLFLFLQAGAALLLPPRSYGDDAARRLFFHVFTGVLVGVVWAICYRPQLERGRLTTPALFVLIALEAVYLALTRVMHPWGF